MDKAADIVWFGVNGKRGLGLRFCVDAADADLVRAQGSWSLTGKGYVTNKRAGYLHRLLAGAVVGQVVDHANMDRLDNTRANLRVCTVSQNNGNTARMRTNTSGFKGVYYEARTASWRAGISIGDKTRHLGRFKTPEEAHEAYKRAAREVFGEYARFE
jgi:hypothetical protein